MSMKRSTHTVTTPSRTRAEKTFTLPMTEELHHRLRVYAANEGKTLALVITEAIEALLAKGGKK
jgi:predicted DNA-binding protein